MKIALVGTGNVAYALMHSLTQFDQLDIYCYGRNQVALNQIRDELNVTPIPLQQLNEVELIIIAISDKAIAEFSDSLDRIDSAIITHTSGATSMEVLKKHAQIGIFYPLYSFSSKREYEFADIPILLDAKSNKVLGKLKNVANFLTERVFEANDDQRLQYHLSAVFANNFTNHMISQAYEMIRQQGLNEEVILPIIRQSCELWKAGYAKDIQTGPAIRNDMVTMEKHLKLIGSQENIEHLYRYISSSILNFYK